MNRFETYVPESKAISNWYSGLAVGFTIGCCFSVLLAVGVVV